ncbi:SRPBCC domain-containing protein [Candidatus Bathyarchaeota archaeon]|nr:MAG: SRPBCC domain-containing protein [Candidatus Bathyarchaeota archaeon]TMI30399.1 MAG: SRPBCC domain-containing protein [Candidatus Bathyarchaeota archaeon]
MAKTLTVKQRYFIRTPIGKVFASLTQPRMLRRWFIASAQLSPRKGGNYTFTWHGGYHHSGKVLSYARDRTLSLSWPAFWKSKPLGMTRATFRLKTKDDGTILDLTHSGFRNSRPWIETYGGTCSGWAYFLTNLKSVLKQNKDLRSTYDNI